MIVLLVLLAVAVPIVGIALWLDLRDWRSEDLMGGLDYHWDEVPEPTRGTFADRLDLQDDLAEIGWEWPR